jgi:FSR family fosmidomycin resistance protein-like MFS transporter
MLGFITHAPKSRRTLYFGSIMHIWSDLCFALLYPLIILMQEDMDLSFTQVGILRSVFSGASGVLQIPAGFMAEGIGEFWLLLGGNVWVSVGLIGMALSPVFIILLITSFLGGLGGGFQHPLASSMVSRAYDDKGRSTAVGTVNFAGDIGKMIAPPLVAGAVAISLGWRDILWVVALMGLVFMAFSVLTRRSVDLEKPVKPTAEEIKNDTNDTRQKGFIALSGIGFLDAMARTASLTFIPFVLIAKDLTTAEALNMLFFIFLGGGFGKFAVGYLGERYSTVSLIWATKGLTAILLVVSIYAPPVAMIPLMIALGIGLNGTSSILYATVAEYVPPTRRARYYGFYYTTNEIGTILAPITYGIIADYFSLNTTMTVMGIVTAAILPASLTLKRYGKPRTT